MAAIKVTVQHTPFSSFVVDIDNMQLFSSLKSFPPSKEESPWFTKEIEQQGEFLPTFGLSTSYSHLFRRLQFHPTVMEGPYEGFIGPPMKDGECFYVDRLTLDKCFNFTLFKSEDETKQVTQRVETLVVAKLRLVEGWTLTSPLECVCRM